MLYSLFYVSTLILLTLSSLGTINLLGIKLESVFVLLVIFCVATSLLLTTYLRLGAKWPRWFITPIGLLGLTHLTSTAFPMPGIIILFFNFAFFIGSWWLCKKIEL